MLDNLQIIPGEVFTVAGSVIEKVIDKISNSVGWLATPKANKLYQLESEEYLIEQIKNDENMPTIAKAAAISKVRKLIKEYINQSNVLDIALKSLDRCANPDDIDDDWLVYFFDKAKNIEKDDMQIIWGKLLAKELDTPSSISKQLLHILTIISSENASAFQKLSNFTVEIGTEPYAIVCLSKYNSLYKVNGLSQGDIINLENVGLLQFSSSGYNTCLEENVDIKYFDLKIHINKKEEKSVGNVLLSNAGRELMSIITDKKKINSFSEFLENFFNKSLSEQIDEMMDLS